MSQLTAIKDMGSLPEAGRIRTGVKSGRAMKALDTFRFTSVDRDALDQLAVIYGGEVKPWADPKANPPKQWELITDADTIQVAVQPGSVSTVYELWSAGGRQRSCDGEVCSTTVASRESLEYVDEPCVCFDQGVRECKIKTRVNLIIPQITFTGTWRYESAGMNAAHTLPSMLAIVEALQSTAGMVPVDMVIVDQKISKGGQTRIFKIVQLRTRVTVDQMLGGQGTYQAQIGTNNSTTMAPSLSAGPVGGTKPFSDPVSESSTTSSVPVEVEVPLPESGSSVELDDDDIVEAELVEDDGPLVFPMYGLDRDTAMAYARDHDKSLSKTTEGWTVG